MPLRIDTDSAAVSVAAVCRVSVRHYAPYLSVIRPFSAASSASSATRPATSTPSTRPSGSPSSPPASGSSHSNVKDPRSRQMDITQLNRLEERAAEHDHVGMSPLGQQGGVEEGEDSVLQEDMEAGSHLTFTDVPLSAVLAGKQKYGSSIHAVSDTDSIAAAMELIKSFGIGAVLVRSSSTQDIVGIISTRDFVDKVGQGLHPTSAPVTDFMTESPVFAFHDDLAIACLELMTKHNFRHLPVRERKSGKCIGLVSIGDLVRIMLKQYRETNQHLKDYIDGRYH